MSGQHFTVTTAEGERSLWMNIRNATDFRRAMMATGKTVALATEEEIEGLGLAPQAVALCRMIHLGPVAAAPSALLSSPGEKPAAAPAAQLAVDQQNTVAAWRDGQGAAAVAVAPTSNLAVDIVANMRARCGLPEPQANKAEDTHPVRTPATALNRVLANFDSYLTEGELTR